MESLQAEMREAKQAEAKKAKQDPLMKRSKESWAEYGKRMAADHAASREASRDDRSDDDRDSDEDLEEYEDDSGGSGEEEYRMWRRASPLSTTSWST